MIAVIDLDSLGYAIGQGNKVLDEQGFPIKVDNKFVYIDKTEEELKASADYFLNKIFDETKCDSYIAYIKGKNTITERLKFNPTYKQDRTSEQPKWWNFVKADLIERYNAVVVDNMEVDDAINITRLSLRNSFICCIDSDLLSQEGTHYNWRKSEWITTTKEQEVYTFWKDMICGTHNNVKGIPKKGEKFVEKAFAALVDTHYRTLVFNLYIEHFGEEAGLDEFYKTYKSLKLKTDLGEFILPTPTAINREVINEGF